MKNTFLYLFILSLLLNIFQYVNSNKILDAKEKEVQLTKERLKIARDSISIVGYNDYFDIEKEKYETNHNIGLKLSLLISSIFILFYFIYPSWLTEMVEKINMI